MDRNKQYDKPQASPEHLIQYTCRHGLRYTVFSIRNALRPKKYFRRVCKTSHQKDEREKAGNILKRFCSFSTPRPKGGGDTSTSRFSTV